MGLVAVAQGFPLAYALEESAQRLFGRSVQLVVTSQPTSGGYFNSGGSSTLTIEKMRVKFSIKKSLGKSPNPALVTITNLAKATRGALEKLPLYAILRAGHDDQLYPLFAGNVTYGRSDLKSPDWETKLQVGDGSRAFSHAFLSKAYDNPVKVNQVVADCAETMGLRFPPELYAAIALQTNMTLGYSAHGYVRDMLSKVLSPFGYSWSIQDGRLQVLKSGQPNARTPWEINVEAGMIGSPEGSVPHKPGKPSELTVKCLLFPQLTPGDTVRITSRALEGALFRINDVEHKGDTEGKDWETVLKCVPLGSPLPSRGKK